jgi:hypothetical protein
MYNATNAATWLRSPPRIALRRNSTQRFVCLLLRDATWLFASLRSSALFGSTQRFVCYNASPRGSASHRAPRLPAAHRASIQRNDLFITSRLHATSLNPTPRGAFQRNDLFVNLSPLRPAYRLTETQLGS